MIKPPVRMSWWLAWLAGVVITSLGVVAWLAGRRLHRVTVDPADPRRITGQERLFDGRYGRLRDVQQGRDGAVYLLTSNRDGRGDPHWPFIDDVWWENQELLHHRAEIALLRDLYRARQG